MFTTIHGDVLSHPTGLIVHGCNCMGIMGGGVASQVRLQYVRAYEDYHDAYDEEGLELGTIIPVEVEPFKFIVNAMTQHGCGGDKRYVNYEAVAQVFERTVELAYQIAERNAGRLLPIVFPQIGAGLAGGDWEIIKVIIDRTIPDDIEKILYIYQPNVVSAGAHLRGGV